jgi:hypothetical protein
MSKQTLLLVGVLAVAVLLAGAVTVQAQITDPPRPVTPPECGAMAPYDLNNDGRVDWRDFDLWVRTVHEGSETCRLNGPAHGCPPWVDVNRDGIASVEDLMAMDQFMHWCVRPPRHTWVPGR